MGQIHGQKYLPSQVFPVYVLPFTVLHVQVPLESSQSPLEVLVQPLLPEPVHLNTEKSVQCIVTEGLFTSYVSRAKSDIQYMKF